MCLVPFKIFIIETEYLSATIFSVESDDFISPCFGLETNWPELEKKVIVIFRVDLFSH